MDHRGRCLCGHYRFHAPDTPLWVAYCHCESCRRFNAAPTAAYVGFRSASVKFEPSPPPHFASSPEVRRSFCEICSTPLAYEAEFFPDEIHLFRSNFDKPEAFEPTRHVLFNEHESDFEIYDDLPRYGERPRVIIAWGPRPALRVLFLCSGNSARSILAEAILNLKNASLEGRRVRGHSAGSQPTGSVAPGALELLGDRTYRLDRLHSKSWDTFTSDSAPPIDWVITLCDSAARETCPTFAGEGRRLVAAGEGRRPAAAGEGRRLHWGLPDPVGGAASFVDTYRAIEEYITAFLDELGADRNHSP